MKELNSFSQTYQQSALTSCMQKALLIQYRIEEREQKMNSTTTGNYGRSHKIDKTNLIRKQANTTKVFNVFFAL